ncbi:MAG: metallophosphoesterase family protein [Desulfobacterales bacterium]|nr:MAG: metallophosphoesterase family protein [Desulfobacterales bacterium]
MLCFKLKHVSVSCRSLVFFLLLIIFFASNIQCDRKQDITSAISSAASQQIRPESFKHIILTWREEPVNSQAVTWKSDVPLHQAVAEIALSDPTPDFSRNSRRYHAETTVLETDTGTAHYYSVNFTNLQSDTLYAYRVGDGEFWSEWFQFRTAAETPKPFSFVYFGDAQHRTYSLWSRTIRAAFLEAPKARFMIYTGDLVDRRNSASQWDEWHKAGGWMMAMIPSIPAAGNHEYSESGLGKPTLSKYWKPQFELPKLGREDLDETVYHVDFQGVRVVVLNSNLEIKDQAKWLENLLANNPNNWTIIAFHHPIYSSAKGRENKELIKYWKPVFEKHEVDLVLQGHDHVYARGRDSCSESNHCRGPIYITSVSGPGMYQLDRTDWMERAAENTQLFQVISIAPSTLKYKAMTATGEVYDAFDLVKNEGRERTLINKIPPNAPDYRF